jgi:hypothetical protein
MALAGAFPWGRAALLPSCYFVSCTVDYTNYGSMSCIRDFSPTKIENGLTLLARRNGHTYPLERAGLLTASRDSYLAGTERSSSLVPFLAT